MKRALGFLVLLAFVLTIPCTNICAYYIADGIAVSALDVCNRDVADISDSFITLIEPAFNLQTAPQIAELPNEKPFIYESTAFPPIDEPPTA